MRISTSRCRAPALSTRGTPPPHLPPCRPELFSAWCRENSAEVDNRHRALAPPYDYEERVVPSYATSKRTDWDKPHS